MLRAFIAQNKKLLLTIGVFVVMLIGYLLLNEKLSTLWQMTIQGQHLTAKHIAETILWLFAWWVAITALDVIVWENMFHKRRGNPVPKLLKSSVSLLILLLVIICIVAFVYQKSITGLVATTGALGIVVGLSLRGVIENAVQGVALNIERPFKTGDLISIPGRIDELATVRDITYRNTYIEDTCGRLIAVPNSVICSNVIRNYSRDNSLLFSLVFPIVLGVRDMHVQDVMRVLQSVISIYDFIASNPPPQIYITDVRSLEVTYNISVWVYRTKATPTDALHILNVNIISQLTAAGFNVGRPYIDYEAIEKQLATVLREVDIFEQLSSDEKYAFYSKEMANKRSLRVLKQVPLFSDFSEEEIASLCEHIRVFNKYAKETIIDQGDTGDVMYILVEGVCQVYINSPDEKELIPVAKLTPPHYFGEMSLLVGDKRSATIIALSDVELYEIRKETMVVVFETHPDIIEKISEKIVEQKLMNTQKITEYSSREAATEKKKFVKELVSKIRNFFYK